MAVSGLDEPAPHGEITWPLGPLELRIMRTVWAHGRANVRAAHTHLAADHPVAYTTVMTVMNRLAEKGLLRRELVGKSYFYTPALTPETLAARVSQQLLHSLQEELGEAAVAQFAAALDSIDAGRLDALRRAAAAEHSVSASNTPQPGNG